MRLFSSLFLIVSSAFAYQVTYPNSNQGWNTTGPNILEWERVDTDPLNFTAVLTNVNTNSDQVLLSLVDGTLGSIVCTAPQGGWSAGSGFRVNLARDSSDLNALLAQSNNFNITAVSSSQSTTSSASTQTGTSSGTTSGATATTSSETGTTPTGTSAAPRGADTRLGWLTAAVTLTAVVMAIF